MFARAPLGLLAAASIALSSGAARADVAVPNMHIVPSEVILTGLKDFPTYRFVIAAVPLSADSGMPGSLRPPTPVAAREGERVPTSTIFFQEVRAIPLDAPEPVTDAWLASSKAPTSGSFTLHPLRVRDDSDETLARMRYHVRQVRTGRIALELLSAVAVSASGAERPWVRPVPVTYEVASLRAPPGWQLFLMPDPSWPRDGAPLPAVRCGAGDVLPLTPGPRTLVAIQGAPEPDGTIAGKPFLTWGYPVDAWGWQEVSPDAKAVAYRRVLEIEIDPTERDGRLSLSHGERFLDAEGDWYHDEDATMPVSMPVRWARWGGVAASALVLGMAAAWLVRRRRRSLS